MFWGFVLFLFCNTVLNVPFIAEEERAGCFTFIVFLLSRGCYCSVSLPCGTIGLVCDCGVLICLLKMYSRVECTNCEILDLDIGINS